MKPHDEPNGLCSLDPITIGAIVAGAGAGAISSFFGGGSSGAAAAAAIPTTPPTPSAAAAAPQTPATTKPKAPSSTPSFVGSAAVPAQSGYGQKSLLGQ